MTSVHGGLFNCCLIVVHETGFSLYEMNYMTHIGQTHATLDDYSMLIFSRF